MFLSCRDDLLDQDSRIFIKGSRPHARFLLNVPRWKCLSYTTTTSSKKICCSVLCLRNGAQRRQMPIVISARLQRHGEFSLSKVSIVRRSMGETSFSHFLLLKTTKVICKKKHFCTNWHLLIWQSAKQCYRETTFEFIEIQVKSVFKINNNLLKTELLKVSLHIFTLRV